jgi:selenocysteine lyase/cysteine desulfurase
VGTPAIEKRVNDLTRRCMRRLEEIGWPSITPTRDDRRGATVAVPSRASPQLCAQLMKRDIVTSSRDDNVRASFHYYNNEDDVESFVAAMKDLRSEYILR